MILLILLLLFIVASPALAGSGINRIKSLFKTQERVTRTGIVQCVDSDRVLLVTDSDDEYVLKGSHLAVLKENKGALVELTGYLKRGQFDVRRYKIVKAAEPEVEEDLSLSSMEEDLSADTKVVDFGTMSEPEEEEERCVPYTIVAGDTLGKISKKFYNSAGKWKIIADKNQIKDPRKIRVGDQLQIPVLQ
jgi:nucleoid-associated protein YgaU